MKSWSTYWHSRAHAWRYLLMEVALVMTIVVMAASPAYAAMRLQERSIYMNNSEAGATTYYRVSFRYMSPDPVGSVELLFCTDPIPYRPCVRPPGMDVSGAALTQQLGETGFTIASRSENRIVLSRTATGPTDPKSAYTLDNIVNPTSIDHAFAVRLKTHASTNATGPQIDFGSMRAQVTRPITITTQVPPMLIFCLAEEVEYNCTRTNDVYYRDMGQLSADTTLTASSQMAVGTNASGGFAITANGTPLSAGTNVIGALDTPTQSQPGENQFGINLVANSSPAVGNDPEGEFSNAYISEGYGQANLYKFESGDVVAYSPSVNLMKKFTVSYIINSSPGLRPGVYSTTVNYIASGRF